MHITIISCAFRTIYTLIYKTYRVATLQLCYSTHKQLQTATKLSSHAPCTHTHTYIWCIQFKCQSHFSLAALCSLARTVASSVFPQHSSHHHHTRLYSALGTAVRESTTTATQLTPRVVVCSACRGGVFHREFLTNL